MFTVWAESEMTGWVLLMSDEDSVASKGSNTEP
jgi:hypothetical protein